MTVKKVNEDVCLEIPVAIHVDPDMEPRVRRVLLLCFNSIVLLCVTCTCESDIYHHMQYEYIRTAYGLFCVGTSKS